MGCTKKRRLRKDMIEAMARDRLGRSPYRELRRLECSWDDGQLILCGAVSSYYLKQLAQCLVQGLEGVEAIDNQVVVHQRPEAWGFRNEVLVAPIF
jgi:hypothetical protein